MLEWRSGEGEGGGGGCGVAGGNGRKKDGVRTEYVSFESRVIHEPLALRVLYHATRSALLKDFDPFFSFQPYIAATSITTV